MAAEPLRLRLLQARAQVVQGDLDAAESSLEQAAECVRTGQAGGDAARPELPEMGGITEELAQLKLGARHRARGNELYRKRNFAGALRAYESGLKALKGCATLHCNKGMALAALGRWAASTSGPLELEGSEAAFPHARIISNEARTICSSVSYSRSHFCALLALNFQIESWHVHLASALGNLKH